MSRGRRSAAAVVYSRSAIAFSPASVMPLTIVTSDSTAT